MQYLDIVGPRAKPASEFQLSGVDGTTKRRVVVASMAAGILVLAVFGFLHLTPSPVTVEFKLGASDSFRDLYLSTFHIAWVKGIFQKHVAQVKLLNYPGGSGEVVEALAKGSIDVGIGMSDEIIVGVANGADIRIVAALTKDQLYTVVTRSDFLREHPEAVRGVVKSLLEANGLFFQEPDDVILPLLKKIYVLPTSSLVRFKREAEFSLDGSLSKSALKSMVESLHTSGVIRERPDITKILVEGFVPIKP